MFWNVTVWVFAVMAALTVGMTIFTQVKYQFNGWLYLVTWIASILLAVIGCVLAFRTINDEIGSIFYSKRDVLAWFFCIAMRYVMFFTNENERIRKMASKRVKTIKE